MQFDVAFPALARVHYFEPWCVLFFAAPRLSAPNTIKTNSMPKRSKEERKKTYHNDTPQERSVRKKTEKLWQCTAEIEKEMVELESKHKRDKKQSSKEADERKADFLRQSAAIQRRIDDNAAEMQKHTQAIAQLEPEANEMRQQLRDLLDQQRERREILEGDKNAKLRPLLEEIELLEGADR